MIFVDTNVVMYAVGRSHPLKEPARAFFRDAFREDSPRLCTSAEVLQELLHAYLPVGRLETLDAAFELIESTVDEIWSVEPDDVQIARESIEQFPELGARDLLHLASCRRRGITRVQTYDRALEAAFR
jgi:uncharacterized protein